MPDDIRPLYNRTAERVLAGEFDPTAYTPEQTRALEQLAAELRDDDAPINAIPPARRADCP